MTWARTRQERRAFSRSSEASSISASCDGFAAKTTTRKSSRIVRDASPRPTMTACPDEDTLVLYLEGTLEKGQEAVVRSHINGCDVCRSVLADAVREPPAEDGMITATDELLVGKYKLLDQLGAGGMGRVYRARHVALERDVAIKFLRGDLVSDATVV